MKRKSTTLVLLLMLLIAGFYGFYQLEFVRTVVSTAATYLRALAEGELESAAEVSEGKARGAISRLEDKRVRTKVSDVNASITAVGRGWSGVEAIVELELEDGTMDVGWYALELLKREGQWKVVFLTEISPDISGPGWKLISSKAVKNGERVLTEYLQFLASGRYDEASRFLAGPARKAHETSSAVLSRGKLFKEVGQVEIKSVWQRGKYMKARAEYVIDTREVEVMVLLYLTRAGWRIVEIL